MKNKITMNIENINYKILESERIVQYTTAYSIGSLILVSVFMRFWLSEPIKICSIESLFILSYVLFSLFFLLYIGKHSKRRTLINKLPSTEILQLCAFVKETNSISKEDFNNQAMQIIFGENITSLIPNHDYFSYMHAEKLIEVIGVTDHSSDINTNTLAIELSEKGQQRLDIYSKSLKW